MDALAKFVKGSEVKKVLGVHNSTLRVWADSGKIRSFRTPGGHRLYELPTNTRGGGVDKPSKTKKGVVYARVSSNKQRDDLDRQVAFLTAKFPDHLVVTDIASGINWRRKGLKTILDLADEGDIDEVVVAARDRLCRFAFDLVQDVFSRRGVRVDVLDTEDMSPEQELSDDLLSIVQIFCCRKNGRRRYPRASSIAVEKDQNKPDEGAEGEVQ